MQQYITFLPLPTILTLTLLVTSTGCSQPTDTTTANTPEPGDDFFAYVNGNWLDNIRIPDDKASYGAFQILRDNAQQDVMGNNQNLC